MKRIFLLLLIIVLIFAGCASKEFAAEDPQIDPNLVTVEVTGSSNKSISIKITNNSDMMLFYGEPYSLEYFENGKWEEVEGRAEGNFFHMAAYGIAPGRSAGWSANLEQRYGALSDGRYRILKHVDFQNDMGEKCAEQQISAEFEVSVRER